MQPVDTKENQTFPVSRHVSPSVATCNLHNVNVKRDGVIDGIYRDYKRARG